DKALCTRRHLSDGDPGNSELRRDISWSFDKIGKAFVKAKAFALAQDAFLQALFIRRALVQLDRERGLWWRDLWLILEQVADAKVELDEPALALAFYAAAREARDRYRRAPVPPAQGAAPDNRRPGERKALQRLSAEDAGVIAAQWPAHVEKEERAAFARLSGVLPPIQQCWADLMTSLGLAGSGKVSAVAP